MKKRIVAINERGLRVGEDHQNAKLTDQDVECIRELNRQGIGYGALAEKFERQRRTTRRCTYWRESCTKCERAKLIKFVVMSNSHGGKRENSGRKNGSLTRKTRLIAEKATAEGITPLEVMLRAMREHVAHADELKAQAVDAETALLLGDADSAVPAKLHHAARAALSEAAALAKDAAPYIHPKLSQVQSNINGDVTASVKIISEFPDD
ncbi:unnamed protein product [Brugia timori]|uniref:HTH_7 domain-containing protein n=1 Tax=Brugia timori TaxID=42155 RepID=A0A0R3Q2X4_9BILA|nr:unnamed protein product [Brugia timori]